MLTTFDAPKPDGHAAIENAMPYDIAKGGHGYDTQRAYLDSIEEVKGDDITNDDTRRFIYNQIINDDLTYINAGNPTDGPHANSHESTVFRMDRVHSLFEFSESLEAWCKKAQAYIRKPEVAAHFRSREPDA